MKFPGVFVTDCVCFIARSEKLGNWEGFLIKSMFLGHLVFGEINLKINSELPHITSPIVPKLFLTFSNLTYTSLFQFPYLIHLVLTSRSARPASYGRIMGCSKGCGPATPFRMV